MGQFIRVLQFIRFVYYYYYYCYSFGHEIPFYLFIMIIDYLKKSFFAQE